MLALDRADPFVSLQKQHADEARHTNVIPVPVQGLL